MKTSQEMSNAEYHATDAISSSNVKTVYKKTLAHWKYGPEFKSTAAMEIGTAVHDMVLEGGDTLIRHNGPDRRGKQWSVPLAEAVAQGKLLMTAADFDLAADVASSVLFHPAGAKMAGASTINEASFFATDPITGMEIKCRPDSYDEERGVIYDIKTCQDASPRAVEADMRKYNYAIQAAFYLHVLNCDDMNAKRFIFVFVEKTAPFAVNCVELSEDYMGWAKMQMHNSLADINEANESQIWDTGYSTGINTIDLPSWLAQDADSINDF